MIARYLLCGALLLIVDAAFACDLPTLVAIPARPRGEDTPALIVATQRYIAEIRQYALCTEEELAAAGGAGAPESVRNILSGRSRAAIAEAATIAALFAERVASLSELYLAEFIAGDGEDCAPMLRLEATSILDGRAVLFLERDGRAYLNVLEAVCPDLERFGRFELRRNLVGTSVPEIGPVQTSGICSHEYIVPYAFEDSVTSRRECALGRFFELDSAQVNRLMEARSAARQAAAPAAAE
jgi:hypothetical protein